MKGNLMARSKQYRRVEDRKWTLTPTWVDKTMVVLKWFLYIMPLVCISIAMWLPSGDLSYSYALTAIWGLALLKITDGI